MRVCVHANKQTSVGSATHPSSEKVYLTHELHTPFPRLWITPVYVQMLYTVHTHARCTLHTPGRCERLHRTCHFFFKEVLATACRAGMRSCICIASTISFCFRGMASNPALQLSRHSKLCAVASEVHTVCVRRTVGVDSTPVRVVVSLKVYIDCGRTKGTSLGIDSTTTNANTTEWNHLHVPRNRHPCAEQTA